MATLTESALSMGWSLHGHQSRAPYGSLRTRPRGPVIDENTKLPNPVMFDSVVERLEDDGPTRGTGPQVDREPGGNRVQELMTPFAPRNPRSWFSQVHQDRLTVPRRRSGHRDMSDSTGMKARS